MKKTPKILLIEPEFYIRVDLDDQLSPHGYMVETVKNVDLALVKLRVQRFDLCLISYEETLGDVIKLLSNLREGTNETPVVLITKRPTEQQLVKLMGFPNIDIVVKPFAINELLKRLQKALGD